MEDSPGSPESINDEEEEEEGSPSRGYLGPMDAGDIENTEKMDGN